MLHESPSYLYSLSSPGATRNQNLQSRGQTWYVLVMFFLRHALATFSAPSSCYEPEKRKELDYLISVEDYKRRIKEPSDCEARLSCY